MLKVTSNKRPTKCSNTLCNIYTNARENITRTRAKRRQATFSWPTQYKRCVKSWLSPRGRYRLLVLFELLLAALYAVCPTRYRTKHFFNNFTTNENIRRTTDTHYRHIPLHFSHNERTPVQISL